MLFDTICLDCYSCMVAQSHEVTTATALLHHCQSTQDRTESHLLDTCLFGYPLPDTCKSIKSNNMLPTLTIAVASGVSLLATAVACLAAAAGYDRDRG